MLFFGKNKKPAKPQVIYYASADQDYLHSQKGFACYTGADLLMLPEIKPLIAQLREAVGGSRENWDQMIVPSLEVFAAYAQFLPAAGRKADGSPESPGGHHTEPLGLLVHSLQTAIVAMNVLRNENVNFGRQPNRRDEHSAAYAVAMALGGLLHDAGKINDWIITAEAGGREHEYRFVESIPEFVARVNGIPLSQVFINPSDPQSAASLPRYMIRGMRPGRGDRHEIVGISKKDLFVSSKAEAFIADNSQELFENFQTFTFESRLPKSMQDPDNRLRRIIALADRTSASFWKKRSGRGGVTPADLLPEIPPAPPAPEAQASAQEAEMEAPDEEQAQEPSSAPNSAWEMEKPAAMSDEELGAPFDPGELPDPKPVQPPQEQQDDEAGPASENEEQSGGAAEGREDDGDAVRQAAPAPDAPISLDPDEASEIRTALSKALRAAFNRCDILANQDRPSALLFPYGYEDAEGEEQFAFFLRADGSAREGLRRIMEAASEDFNANLSELAGTDPHEVLRTAMRIFPACGFTMPSKAPDGLYAIWPMALWRQSHREDGIFRAFMLADWRSVVMEGSRACVEDLPHWRMRGVYFAEPSEIAFSLSPERLERNRSPLLSVLAQPEAGAEEPQAKPPKDAHALEAAPESKAPEPVAESANDAVIEAGEMFFGSDMFGGMRKAVSPGPASPQAPSSAAEPKQSPDAKAPAPEPRADSAALEDPEDELSVFKRPRVRNEFKTDREDQDTISDLQLMQKQFYLPLDECSRLAGLPAGEREERLSEIKIGLLEKCGGSESVFHKFQRELNLAAKGKNSLIALKNLNGGNVYAAFVWDHRTMDSVKKSKGASLLERLMDHGLVALCRRGRDHEAIHDELDYFSCVMLDPLVTQYLVLCGGMDSCLEKVEIRTWADPKRPPSGKEVMRYFEHYVMQSGPKQSIFGFFAHGSDPLRGIRIDCRALEECARKLNSTCQKTIRRRVLDLNEQETPPFMWREGGEYVICFFSKADPRFPDHDRVASEEKREAEAAGMGNAPSKS